MTYPATAWSDDLSLGIPSIDAHHRELFRRAYGLLAALGEQRAPAELFDLVGWLGDYVETHFAEEGALMAGLGYPGRARHEAAHAAFAAEYRWLAVRLAAAGPTPTLAMRLSRLLCEWLREHVLTLDRELAVFVRSREAAGPGAAA